MNEKKTGMGTEEDEETGVAEGGGFRDNRRGLVVGGIVLVLLLVGVGIAGAAVATTTTGSSSSSTSATSPQPTSKEASPPSGFGVGSPPVFSRNQTIPHPTASPTTPTDSQGRLTLFPTISPPPALESSDPPNNRPALSRPPMVFLPQVPSISVEYPTEGVRQPFADAAPTGRVKPAKWGPILDDFVVTNDTSFGSLVAMSSAGGIVAVTAPNSSAVYVLDPRQRRGWLLVGLEPLRAPNIAPGSRLHVSVNFEGHVVAFGGDRTVQVLDLGRGPVINGTVTTDWTQRGNDWVLNSTLTALSLSSTGTVLALSTAGNNNNNNNSCTVCLYSWNGRSWDRFLSDIVLPNETLPVTSTLVSSRGSPVAIATRNRVCVVEHDLVSNTWQPRGAGFVTSNNNNNNNATATTKTLMAMSDDGRVLAFANSHGRGIQVWEWQQGNAWVERGRGVRIANSLRDLALSRQGNALATVDGNNGVVQVLVWDAAGNQWTPQGSIIDSLDAKSVSLSSDGSIMSIGGNDRINGSGLVSLYLWG